MREHAVLIESRAPRGFHPVVWKKPEVGPFDGNRSWAGRAEERHSPPRVFVDGIGHAGDSPAHVVEFRLKFQTMDGHEPANHASKRRVHHGSAWRSQLP